MQLLRFNGLTWRKPSCCSGLTPVAIALTTRLLRFKQMLRFSNNTKPELPIAQVPSLKAPTIALLRFAGQLLRFKREQLRFEQLLRFAGFLT